MIKFIRRITKDFKEYLLVILLTVISLSILSSNEKPEIKRLRSFAIGNFAVLNELVNSIASILKTKESIDDLKKENARLMLEVNRLRGYGLENDELRSMLSLKDTSSFPLISAHVISKIVNKIQGNFIINRGEKDGVLIGMPVINDKGLIGLITDIEDNYAVVRTIYNSSLSIAVTIQSVNVDGVLSWNGYELVIKNIPASYNVQVGDRVETSSLSTLFSPYIPIGIVSKKESNILGLLHNITVKPFADIFSVNDLFVVKVVPSKQIDHLEMNLMK